MHNILRKKADGLRSPRENQVRNEASAQMEFSWAKLLASASTPESQTYLRAMLIAEQSPGPWRGEACVPPGSLLDLITSSFARGSSVPLDLPFFAFLAILSGELAQHKVVIEDGDDRINPQLWLVLLAGSGAGKSFAVNKIRAAIPTQCSIPGASGIVSSAALFDLLIQNPTGLILKDEFGRFVRKIEKDEGSDIKDMLLDLFNCQRLERSSKKDGLRVIESPVCSILGLSVDETWRSCVSAESMLDGFAQRFLYVVTHADPARPGRDFPRWKIDESGWADKWTELTRLIQPVYMISPEAGEAFDHHFRVNFDALPEAFFRRVARASNTYALCYHLLLGNGEPILTPQDYAWAGRLMALHLRDAAEVLRQNGLSDLQRIISKCEAVIKRRGPGTSPRDLVAGVREIRTANEARALLQLISQT